MQNGKYPIFKPIFHCDAIPFALGPFALPNEKNTNMLVSLVLGDANFLRWPCTFLFFLRYPRRQPLMPVSGPPTQNIHVGHVHVMLFMSISFVSGTQRKLVFHWNMGFKFWVILFSHIDTEL